MPLALNIGLNSEMTANATNGTTARTSTNAGSPIKKRLLTSAVRHEVSCSQFLWTQIASRASKNGNTIINSVVRSVGLGCGFANTLAIKTNVRMASVPNPAASNHAFDEGPRGSLSSFSADCLAEETPKTNKKSESKKNNQRPIER